MKAMQRSESSRKQAEIGRGIAEPEHALPAASGQRARMPRLINCRATMPRRCE
jgi:hypothetical protein